MNLLKNDFAHKDWHFYPGGGPVGKGGLNVECIELLSCGPSCLSQGGGSGAPFGGRGNPSFSPFCVIHERGGGGNPLAPGFRAMKGGGGGGPLSLLFIATPGGGGKGLSILGPGAFSAAPGGRGNSIPGGGGILIPGGSGIFVPGGGGILLPRGNGMAGLGCLFLVSPFIGCIPGGNKPGGGGRNTGILGGPGGISGNLWRIPFTPSCGRAFGGILGASAKNW